MKSPLVVNTLSTGADVAGVEKVFSNRGCKLANVELLHTDVHSAFLPSSRLVDSWSACSRYYCCTADRGVGLHVQGTTVALQIVELVCMFKVLLLHCRSWSHRRNGKIERARVV